MKVVNGHIISGTPICVDYWLETPEQKYLHFLTHLHADHIVNLKSTFCEYIYTSPFNAWLLRRWFNISREFVVVLEVGESHVMCEPNTNTQFCVTVLDANHCPGSVMFLFQGEFGNFLYTGDFRYNPKILEHPMLKSLIETDALDRLYLDNTFAADHCEFPPREEALRDVINVIKQHPDHSILLGVRKLGKEEVLRAIALEFKEKVCVSAEKLRILTKLGYENVFTTNSEDSRIFVKEMSHLTSRYIDQIRAERGPVVTILLTALYSVIPPDERISSISVETEKGFYKIPYSDHSCHSELVEFVSRLKPKKIFPIVSSSIENKVKLSQNKDISGIIPCTWQNSVIPKSIMQFSAESKNVAVINPFLKNYFVSSLKENVVSYMTEDESETSSKNVKIIPKRRQVLKDNTQERSIGQIENGGESRLVHESPEINSERKSPPSVCRLQSEVQGNVISQKSINKANEEIFTTHIPPETNEEYYTLSDEDLTQLSVVTNPQNHVTVKKTLTNVDVLEESDVNLESIQIVYEGNVDSQSQILHPVLKNGNSQENQINNENHANFNLNTLVNKSKYFKKRLLTSRLNQPDIEEETESNVSDKSYDGSAESSAESVLSILIQVDSENVLNKNFKGDHLTQNSACEPTTNDNLKEIGDLQKLNDVTKVVKNKTCLDINPTTTKSKGKHTKVKNLDEQNEGKGSKKLSDDLRVEKSKRTSVTRNIDNCARKHYNEQSLEQNPYFETITDQNIIESQVMKDNAGKKAMFFSSTPVQQNKFKICNKPLSIPMSMNKQLTKENLDIENSLSLPNTKTFQDKEVVMEVKDWRVKANAENTTFDLTTKRNSLDKNCNNSKKNCSKTTVASKLPFLKKLSPAEIYEITNKSKGEQNNDDIRVSILKNIFQPTLPTKKQVVPNTSQFNGCVQNPSGFIPGIPIIVSPTHKAAKLCEDKRSRSSNSKDTFGSASLIKRTGANDGQASGCTQYSNISHLETLDPLTKSQRKKPEDVQMEDALSGSDSTVSDVDCNGLNLDMFDLLDKRNDEVYRSSKTNSSASNNIRISEKFQHLVVKNIPHKSSASGLFSPVLKTKQNKNCAGISSLNPNKEVLKQKKNSLCLVKERQNETKRPVTKVKNYSKLRENVRQNGLEISNNTRHSECNRRSMTSRNEEEKFEENFNNIYKSWKSAVKLKMLTTLKEKETAEEKLELRKGIRKDLRNFWNTVQVPQLITKLDKLSGEENLYS